jgi:hypothetical protein
MFFSHPRLPLVLFSLRDKKRCQQIVFTMRHSTSLSVITLNVCVTAVFESVKSGLQKLCPRDDFVIVSLAKKKKPEF